MTGFEILLFIASLLVMLIGMVGVILPIIPGTPLIFVTALIYALITDFARIDNQTLIIFAVLTVASYLLDWLATSYGVKRMGGSYFGMLGAFVGMVAGLFIGGLAGLVIGAFVGAVVFEILIGKKHETALRAGMGSFLGFLAGGLIKFIIAVVMIGMFVVRILF